jgi:hypothetical protein
MSGVPHNLPILPVVDFTTSVHLPNYPFIVPADSFLLKPSLALVALTNSIPDCTAYQEGKAAGQRETEDNQGN